MRVAVNATPLASAQIRGWTRYTVNLLAALPARGVDLVLLARTPPNPEHLARLPAGSFEVRIAPPMRYLRWEQRWVPRQCRESQADVYHCPLNFGVPAVCPVPRVLTLHDAIDQVYYTRSTGWRDLVRPAAVTSRFYHWLARHSADHVITVSEFSKADLVRYLGVKPSRVSVVPEAADPGFQRPVTGAERSAVCAKWDLNRSFFFYIGGWERRKNVPFLLRAFATAGLVDVELVLAGGGREGEQAQLADLSAKLGVAARVRFLGNVPDPDLPALYSAALGFVYPSEYEGFGLQLVEAMAVGCPVLAARATCLPEVLGSGGDTFSLGDPGELAGLLVSLAADPAYRADLAGRASARSADFSWDRTAEETVAVYRRLLRRQE